VPSVFSWLDKYVENIIVPSRQSKSNDPCAILYSQNALGQNEPDLIRSVISEAALSWTGHSHEQFGVSLFPENNIKAFEPRFYDCLCQPSVYWFLIQPTRSVVFQPELLQFGIPMVLTRGVECSGMLQTYW
jgi:hypothetical protein